MEWIAFGTVVALAWWCWRRTRERASERKAARERQDLLERNIRLTTTRSLNEAKAEIGTLKDRMSRLTESYKDARTEIATLKKRQITAQATVATESYKDARTESATLTLKKRQITARATAAQATKKKLPSHQGPATPTTRRAPERERCGCRGEVENCHFCFGSGWVGGGYPKY